MSKPDQTIVVKPKQAPIDQVQGEAPPPYAASSSSQPLLSHPSQSHPGQIEAQTYSSTQNGWTPPSNPGVAKSRALRRFWSAFFVGWGIWIIVGLIIGGGVSDIEHTPSGRHGHWDKHGDWKEGDWFGSVNETWRRSGSKGIEGVDIGGEGSGVVIGEGRG